MLGLVKMRFIQIADALRSGGWRSLLREAVFLRRTAMIVEKDLAEVTERPAPLNSAQLKLIEIDEKLLHAVDYDFAVRHRKLKALRYLKMGYRGFAMARGKVIFGDLWYYTAESTDDVTALHPDLRQFGFKAWERNQVYTFDIFVAPAARKLGVSAAFQNNAMALLASQGYTKAFAWYFADNIPAVWCTRVTNKWKEVRAVSVSRFLAFIRIVPDNADHIYEPAPGMGLKHALAKKRE